MERREALRNVALLLGGTIISSQSFLTSCVFKGENKRKDNDISLKADEVALLDNMGETIIPTTDTPGAKAVEIGSFISMMLQDCYTEKQQEVFKKRLATISDDFQLEYGIPFRNAQPNERENFLYQLEKEMEEYYLTTQDIDPVHFYQILKELVLLGYFTSEIGATKALKYMQTPGEYLACIPYEKGGKAWLQRADSNS